MEKLQTGMEKASELAKQAAPHLQKLEPFIRQAYPYCHTAKDYSIWAYEKAKPYYTDFVFEMVFALVLVFLGGNFALTLACYQAFNVSGRRLITKSVSELGTSYEAARRALEKDPEASKIFGAQGGQIGPMDMLTSLKEMALAKSDEEKRVARTKTALILKCIDPNKVLDAFLGLWTGVVAVLATLRSKFVLIVSIGASAGQRVADVFTPWVKPKLYEMFPQHHSWVDFGLRMMGSVFGIMLSFILVRPINAFNAAFKGAPMFVETMVREGKKRKYIQSNPSEWQKKAAGSTLAMFGFIWQLWSGFNLPFLLKLPLMPVFTIEYILAFLAL